MECRIGLCRPEEEQQLHGEDCFGYNPYSNVHFLAQAVPNLQYHQRGITSYNAIIDTVSHFK